jgi:hypothetical protein
MSPDLVVKKLSILVATSEHGHLIRIRWIMRRVIGKSLKED